jgi:hypothetical protein
VKKSVSPGLKSNPPPRALSALGDEDADGRQESSITEVNGTIARFEMALSPKDNDRFAFGPPRSQRWPSILFLVFGSFVMALVVFAVLGSSNSRLHVWLIEGDRDRPLPAWLLGAVVFFSSSGVFLRARMRGVIVTAEGVEARYLLALGIPKVMHWSWAQIDRFVIDAKQGRIMVELWNGGQEMLPPVERMHELADVLERIAMSKKKDVTRLKDLL